MTAVLDELGLTELACQHRRAVPGRGRRDPGRDRRPDPVHLRPGRGQTRRPRPAGTNVRHVHRQARLSGAGRPRLRVAAWRAVWGCLQTNRVYAARYRHLTSRETNQLKPTQAQTAVAARDPAPAARRRHPPAGVGPGRRRPRHPTAGGGCGITRFAPSAAGDASPELGRGEPSAALRTLRYLVGHHRPPRPVVDTTRSHAAEHTSITAMQGPTTRTRAPAHPLTLNTSR